jgi:hypothetical protein
MCKYGTYTKVSLNGETQSIDSCIASLVQGINEREIKSWASCCGHQRNLGSHGRIDLKDGRILLICDGNKYLDNSAKYLLQLSIHAYWHKFKHHFKWKIKNLIWRLSTMCHIEK